ncbi:disease resistance protein At4g27190-like [Cannabis sativa]|uniref:disease resistance protein At4g27190-like n=1 Tax=Cannabis sativa TaxID=3483 RepID=UPI0029CAA12D|nr:disease resistance protein At4g27190-like [Cannabis sativa]
MDFIISIATKIVEYAVAPAGRQLGYLFHYTANVSELRNQLEDLNNATQRMERRVNEALNNCHEIEVDVQTWLNNAGKVSVEAITFLNPESHAQALCSCGSPHHLVMRHQLSRKAKKMSNNVRVVVSKKNEFDSVPISYPRQPEGSSTTPAKGYQTFDSRSRIMKKIMAAVGDGNRRRIGLHGMGGVGKTMLADEIGRRAQEEKLFSKVVKITISQTPNTKEIQQQIAEMLDITSFNQIESTSKRAELLRMRLKQEENKILLILDDIWKELDLEAIGIDHQESRMLLTSRYLHVLRNFMDVDESNVFLIEALESSEGISLFKRIIGETKVEKSGDYKALALEIVDECAGLPIAIATVAHALKCNNMDNLFIWKDALQRLKNSNFRGIEGMHDKVYLSIRLSYDFLGRHEEEAKSLLLLCALHKEDQQIDVEDLIRYSIGWNLLQGVRTVSEARNRVNSLVVKLKSHCLLLDETETDKVKMHDVIRDVCIAIAKEDDDDDHGHRMFMNSITSAATYEELVVHQRHKASKAISFVDFDDFDNLPQILECPGLELLLLSRTRLCLESIPNDFFEQTGQLKSLGMNGARLRSLPLSFRLLQNLQTLCLCGSFIEDIAVIGELKNLKVLDVSWSFFIKRLPKEIGALQRLQVLDLRVCRNLKVIEANVISNLTQMEELYLPTTFERWDKIEEDGTRNASLIEIKSLQRLTALCLYVPSDQHVLPEGLFDEKLERYQISIRGDRYLDDKISSSRCLHLCLSQLDQVYARELVAFMTRSEYLSLEGYFDVAPCLVKEGFPRLKELTFEANEGAKYIINPTDMMIHDQEAFPCLEELTLRHLESLESIVSNINVLPRGSFFNQLRKVDVYRCGRLKNLFPLSIAKLLHEISVQECEMIEEIIVREDGDDDHEVVVAHNNSSLQLRSLRLNYLLNLVQFYCSPLIEDYSMPLFSETVSFPKLEDLTIHYFTKKMLWPDQVVESSSSSYYMQNLTRLNVSNCNNLKYLFSFSIAQKFVNLKSIQVKDCKAMEDIIRVVDQLGEEDDQLQRDYIILFPKLECVKLDELSSLQRIYGTACTDLSELVVSSSTQTFFKKKIALMPNLKEFNVRYCHNLESLLPSAIARRLVQLERLSVTRCGNIKVVIVSNSSDDKEYLSFEKLESLELDRLPNLLSFCEGDYCIECPLLSKLVIDDCPKMKEFMKMVSTPNKQISHFKHNNKVIFPMLKNLQTAWSEGIKEIFEMSSNSIILFPNLSNVSFKSYGDEPIGVPNLNSFLHKYHKIRTLSLYGSFVNLSSTRGSGNGNSNSNSDDESMDNITATHLTSIASSLETLYVIGAEKLDYVFGIEPSHAHNKSIVLFPNLDYVCVQDCNRLLSLAPSNMSFHNLGNLEIKKCHGLRYLFSSSTATTLLQLREMRIDNCKELRDIIITINTTQSENSSGNHHHYSILVFENLNQLFLTELPNLESFYSGNKVMSFPSLKRLYIRNCPKIRRFSGGIIKTSSSLLKTIEVDGKEEILEPHVNTTWENLFGEHNTNNNDS